MASTFKKKISSLIFHILLNTLEADLCPISLFWKTLTWSSPISFHLSTQARVGEKNLGALGRNEYVSKLVLQILSTG